jgi:hypothetical protein
MPENVYYSCDSKEINTIASVATSELEKGDWSADFILSMLLNELKKENELLSQSIAYVHGDILAENLRKEDKIADDDFMCLKQFVKANMYMPDAEIAKCAEEVYELIKSHNIQLNKLNHEMQISMSWALLQNLGNTTFKPKVDKLLSVPDRVVKFEESTTALSNALKKLSESNANKVEYIAPSIQKNKVRDIINQKLIPHLNSASAALPEKYAASFKIICECIEETNKKVRSRKTRNQKNTEETTIVE